MKIKLEISAGEFWDRLTIARVKSKRIKNRTKLQTVQAQMVHLHALSLAAAWPAGLQRLVDDLERANAALWVIEDDIRALDGCIFPLEKYGNMDCLPAPLEEYLQLARAVYVTNTRRSNIKAEIDRMCDCEPEAKEYKEF